MITPSTHTHLAGISLARFYDNEVVTGAVGWQKSYTGGQQGDVVHRLSHSKGPSVSSGFALSNYIRNISAALRDGFILGKIDKCSWMSR